MEENGERKGGVIAGGADVVTGLEEERGSALPCYPAVFQGYL